MRPDPRTMPLTDTSIMPFGVHLNARTQMQWVPLTYWRYYLAQPWAAEWPHVKAYAEKMVKPAAVATVRSETRTCEPTPARRER